MSHSPRQIDYATPNPRRGWAATKILLVTAMVLVGVLILAVAWWGIATPLTVSTVTITVPSPAPTPPPAPIVLPSDPMIIDLRQRGGLQLPGGPGTPSLWIGDITGGRVLVTITDDNHSWVVSRSMQQGATVSFTHVDAKYYLTLKKLTNRITKDEASFELSSHAPTTQNAEQ